MQWQRLQTRDEAGNHSHGNIDVVLVALDPSGNVIDFGALEVQAVYISGNIRNVFRYFMEDPGTRANTPWAGETARPDYLSSSRKRLAPQLLYKGGILRSWSKKLAVALHRNFFATLPVLPEVPREQADLAWFIYDLRFRTKTSTYQLVLHRVVYTQFDLALLRITQAEAGPLSAFEGRLQRKLRPRKNSPHHEEHASREYDRAHDWSRPPLDPYLTHTYPDACMVQIPARSRCCRAFAKRSEL